MRGIRTWLVAAVALACGAGWPGVASAQAPAQAPAPAPEGGVPGCKELQASGNPQYPPYLWRDPADENRLVGAAAEMAQWLAREIGVPITIRYAGPWSRVQAEARAGNLDLIAGAFFTLPRTEYMDYFYPAFRETRSVILIADGTKLAYRQWSDLTSWRGVTVIQNSFGEEFDRFARERLQIAQVASLDQAIEMVRRGRADYLVYEDSPAAAYLARLGATGIRQVGPPVASERLFVTMSYKSSCNTPELRGRLQRALYKLARDRQMDEFVERAIQLWRRQSN